MANTALEAPETGAASGIHEVSCSMEAVAGTRRLVRTALAGWGLTALSDDASLLVTELAANAAATGCRGMRIRVTRPAANTVRIEIQDGSRSLPVMLVGAPADAESGRGLVIVQALTGGHWGVVREAFGKTVWAELKISR